MRQGNAQGNSNPSFTSSNRELALRGYEVSAARYLAKPLQTGQLREALLYCCQTSCASQELLIPAEKGQSKLAPSDILYVEFWEQGSRLPLTGGPIVTSAFGFQKVLMPGGNLPDNLQPQAAPRCALLLYVFCRGGVLAGEHEKVPLDAQASFVGFGPFSVYFFSNAT